MLFHQLRLLFILFALGLGVSCASQKPRETRLNRLKETKPRWLAAFASGIYENQPISECPNLGGEYECPGVSGSSFISEGIEGSSRLYYFNNTAGGRVLNIVADGKAHSIDKQPGVDKAYWYLAYCKDKELVFLKSYLPSDFQSTNVQSGSAIHRWRRTEDKKMDYETLSITVFEDENEIPFGFNSGSCIFKREI